MKNILLTALLTLSSLSFASDFPDDPMMSMIFKSDSGIRGPVYDKIVSSLKELEIQYADKAQVITYGQTINNRPLTIVKIAHQNILQAAGTPAIYIGGSIHGDEYLNIEDRLPQWILENSEKSPAIKSFLDAGGAFYIAPILNPDGYDARERENAHNVDLNRDYTVLMAGVQGFKEPETRALYDYLARDLEKTQRQLKVALDYHCCIGALLYPWSFTGPTLPTASESQHQAIGRIMQSELSRSLQVGKTPIILGYSARGTSKDFYYERFGALGFTFEGRRAQENKFFKEHTKMWEKIVQMVTPSY
jgi:succinylglutamate desuccinylase